jgi:hypothetical protein
MALFRDGRMRGSQIVSVVAVENWGKEEKSWRKGWPVGGLGRIMRDRDMRAFKCGFLRGSGGSNGSFTGCQVMFGGECE